MQPKFNTNTAYIPLADGIYFHSNRAFLRLKGKSLYRLLEHLVPYLDGRYTLEEITQGLDAARKTMITNLLETLLSHHFLTDISQDLPHNLHPAELATYAANIAFIESFHASAAHHFELFRNKRLLIIGSGLSCTALVQASLVCGVRQISVIITPEFETLPVSQANGSSLFSPDDPEQTVQILANPEWDNEANVLKALQDYEVVLHFSDRAMLARAQLLNRLCIEQKKTFLQALIVEHHAWIGPVISPQTGGCWECAWRRLQSHQNVTEQLPLYTFRNHTTASTSQTFAEPAATVLANRLVFELFKHITQAGPVEVAESLIDIDLRTLLSEHHVFAPHPHCQACQHPIDMNATQFLEQIQQLQQQDPLDPKSFIKNPGRYIDPQSGLFSSVDEDDFVQVPLAVCKIDLSNPMLIKSRIDPVIGVGTNMNEARLSAYRKACVCYAANLVEPRRLLSHETIQQYAVPLITVDQLIGAGPLHTNSETWTWAIDLHTQQICLLPAALAFPALHNGASAVINERGIGLGMSWAEAICQALLDWGTYLTITQLRNAQQPYAQVNLAKSPLTPTGTYWRDLLNVVDEPISIYDVTGDLQLPTFAICSGAHAIAYSAHCDSALALEAGLQQAIQHYQSTHFQQPEYDLAPVPDLPPNLRGDQWCVPQITLPEAWPARQEWLLQSLQNKQGIHALALPLDHDPALRQAVPYIVRILLASI